MYRETWFQALCLGKPIAPWRREKEKARKDLITHGLGSYDEWGKFFITVPGDLARKSVWVDEIVAA